ncbi:hemolysin [Vibrio sp. HA2012]|uniref:BON domain-containing protein n=1 Tax=Vibrio sp. HA2012 TaxID=1971595 RepID=UPI000C2C929B|nr:BON domain-containing protein [Vibrio sp. HA2012]PJC84934.1 hemolysin [Vibrio sp. HA2012]
MKNYLNILLISAITLSLSGCVGGVVIAGAAATATANVIIDPRSNRDILIDNRIELDVSGLGNKAPFTEQARVTASAYQGEVLLFGQAIDQQVKNTLTAEVLNIDGVKSVNNQMQVRPLLPMSEVSNDVWITTKVKSRLLTEKELRGIKIKVYTEAGEVYLLGVVTREQAEIAIEITRNISGVKKVIQGFRYGVNESRIQEEEPAPTPAPVSKLSAVSASAAVSNEASAASDSNAEIIPYIEPVEVNSYQEQNN